MEYSSHLKISSNTSLPNSRVGGGGGGGSVLVGATTNQNHVVNGYHFRTEVGAYTNYCSIVLFFALFLIGP